MSSLPSVERIVTRLSDNWFLSAVDSENVSDLYKQPIPGAVPGCVHETLINANLIQDPYFECNEHSQEWIGKTDWCYECRFGVADELFTRDTIELVCEGLDTIVRIELNGHVIGESFNMHHPHRFDVKRFLKERENHLRIIFFSALNYAHKMADELGNLPRVYQHPYNFIRKMACNFGWDWSPALITCGPWKPVYLEGWNTIRIDAVRPLVRKANSDIAIVDVIVEFHNENIKDKNKEYCVTATLVDRHGKMVAETLFELQENQSEATIRLSINQPELWWPIGYGLQPLYMLEIKVTDHDSHVILDRWTDTIGLRTIHLDTSKDDIGTKFVLSINGKAVFCKGSNWIPDDCLLTRVSEARYRKRLQQAVDANMNMIRVWGGGIYETDTFYRLCDEMGILVWQDFLFACAMYPEEPPYPQLIREEAAYNIKRLSKHPSLVLWNGSNENLWAYLDWHEPKWCVQVGDRPWGKRYYMELLPDMLRNLDTTRPYIPSSPFSFSDDIHPLNDSHGISHIYDVWVERDDYPAYRNHRPRFAAEFGFQGPATYSTFSSVLSNNHRSIHSDAWKHHQKAPQGDDKNFRLLEKHFTLPDSFDEMHYLLQLNQARAITVGCEWFRSLQPDCMGVMYWQLNDCWPCISWSAIDHGQRCKPLWYATRRFFQDRLLTIHPDNAELTLKGINDTDDLWDIDAVIQRMSFDGTILSSVIVNNRIPPRSARAICILPDDIIHTCNPTGEFIVARCDNHKATWFFDIDKRLNYPEPSFDANIKNTGNTFQLTIHAHNLIRDLAILVDRLDNNAFISDQIVTVLPDEAVVFEISGASSLSIHDLTTRPVFECANFYGNAIIK